MARKTRLPLLLGLGLAAVCCAVFWPVTRHPFIFFDDSEYVTQNARVLAGLSWQGALWALGSFQAANWHPVTWVSHMADVSLFGLDAGGHHLVSLALHVLAALLCFRLLLLLTGAAVPALLVAALFALHPLHVEPVAWVAERKELLGAAFWMLTLLAYRRYLARPGFARYLAVAGSLALGLAAKPMLVTLPAVLLLLDFWPFGRIGGPRGLGSAAGPAETKGRPVRVVLEKAPLLAMAAASSLVTLHAQRQGGAVKSLAEVPLSERAANAVVSALRYLEKTVWPQDLAVIYPHPGDGFSAWHVGAAAGALLAATAVALRLRRRSPWLAVGWLWYLGTLVPVIGLVQVGSQAMADRYTYIPLIGVFIALAWGLAQLAALSPLARRIAAPAAIVALLACAAAGRRQVGYWESGVTLFEHAVAVTAENHLALNQLGIALARENRHGEAEAALRRAIEAQPRFSDPHYNLGLLFDTRGDADRARDHYLRALGLNPRSVPALNNLGRIELVKQRWDAAADYFEKALSIDPENATVRANLALATRRANRGEHDPAPQRPDPEAAR